jgi:helix-turn-helix protein
VSYQAMTWAIEQRAGSPSAKAVLCSIANYANQHWVCWPSQELIAKEGEQSIDSVQKRQKELVARGLLRKVRMRRHGRRTTDFLILPPSPVYAVPVDQLWEYLPAGCEPMDDATANSGSADSTGDQESPSPAEVTEIGAPDHAAADSGSVETTDSPATLPPHSGDATATERQQEPVKNQESYLQTSFRAEAPIAIKPAAPASVEKPQAGIQGEQAADPEFETDWQNFVNGWPGPILDPPKAQAELRKLSVTDRRACIGKLPDYGAYCRRVRHDPMKPHLFVKKRSWEGLGHKASSDPDITGFVRASSAEGAAVRVIWGLAGMSPREIEHAGERGYWCGFRMTDQLRALALAPFPRGIAAPPTTWPEFDEGSANHLRWREITKATIQRSVLVMRHKIRAPWPWPPRVDGTLSSAPEPSSTGPPPELSPAEQEEFSGSM